MAEEHIGIYLNDHLAGAVAALDLLDRLQTTCAGTDKEHVLAELRTEIAADVGELESLMSRLKITRSIPRKVAGWLTEKMAQLKLVLDDRSGGRLRLFESFEALALGIEGKRALWRALAAASDTLPGLRVLDYQRLEQRAEEQRRRVETLRLEAAKAALMV